MKRLFVCVLALVLFSAPWGARAQDALRIAAVVNDEMISVYDLNMRLNLVVAFSGLPDTNETRQRLGPQILRSLIDDELKRQEATRLGIPVSEGEVERALRRVEKGNGFDKGGLDKFLASRNIRKSSLTTQIESEIAWRKLVQGRFGALSQVSDEEIDDVLRSPRKFQHLVVPCCFQTASLKLVANLVSLFPLQLLIVVVLKFADEFNALAEPIHNQLLATKSLDLRLFQTLLLLG